MDYKLDRNWKEDVIRYPEPAVEVVDPRFAQYVIGMAPLERLWTGGRWTEGPVWFGDGRYLLFSDIPNNRMLRWAEESGETTEFRTPSNYTNGNTRDLQGRLISCEHDSQRVTRTEHDGTITVLIDQFEGKKLNAPNDVVVHRDGSVWFTDPGYGILSNYEGHLAELELPTSVYRLEPESGRVTRVTDSLEKPNGLAFSPDYQTLYVSDTGASHKPDHPHHIRMFDVVDGGRLENERMFCDMGAGVSDGFRVDVDGNVWTSAGWGGDEYDGIHVFTAGGELIGRIHIPETVSNLTFGGIKKNRLFITAGQSLYSIYVEAIGFQKP